MNPTMQKDVYKEFHHKAYHPEVTEVYSNFTNRSGKHSNTDENGVILVGVQYFIKDYLIRSWNDHFFNVPKEMAVKEHKRILSGILGYTVDVTYLEELHDLGYLPLKIKSLQEGTFVPYQVPSLTIVNTVPGFQWLTNMIETVLSTEIWPISTSATTSRAYYKAIKEAFEKTGGIMELLPFMGHDFSFRGMFGRQAAAMSGFGHLTSGFAGTDSIPAVLFAEKYYNANANVDTELVGASVDATEHSVTCSWIDEGEVAFIKYLMREQSKTGILSIVSDTWDFWRLVTDYLPAMKDEIMARDGTVVIRPDSGDPVDVLCGVEVINVPEYLLEETDVYDYALEDLHDKLIAITPHGEHGGSITGYYKLNNKIYEVEYVPDWNRYDKQFYYIDGDTNSTIEEVVLTPEQLGLVETLWNIFGGTINEKGFKQLDSHIGAIYGDAITLRRQAEIIKRLIYKGFVPSVVLGIGSYSFQYVTRDTHGSAVKATNVIKNGKDKAIFKDPKTDTGKKSAKGLLRVDYNMDGVLTMFDEQTREQEDSGLLNTVFLDGNLVKETSLNEIREKVKESY